jgi:flagellar biosynthesis protein FlhG
VELTKKLWSIGGGKGGIGKSVFTLGLGISLSRMGKKIILVDADLGGANLHTLMGVRFPPCTLEDFFLNKVARLEDVVIDTQVEGIGLICGADDILGSANPTYAQKVRILKQIEDLPADLVLIDLGAGTSYNSSFAPLKYGELAESIGDSVEISSKLGSWITKMGQGV